MALGNLVSLQTEDRALKAADDKILFHPSFGIICNIPRLKSFQPYHLYYSQIPVTQTLLSPTFLDSSQVDLIICNIPRYQICRPYHLQHSIHADFIIFNISRFQSLLLSAKLLGLNQMDLFICQISVIQTPSFLDSSHMDLFICNTLRFQSY